ncbi:hypothetical protein M407DRAFT_19888 [Tulasnella calospora MUT 4182]|uniref:F-box domain-containing protein n=1 Tax=Tulasnella calospora MUT 4182 TaxID=1051891 RepID=A0A0C3QQY0_9AGAM|nr:hypothetical protein M407DRAFT_19888 [Tulasnella calospora MUT 4182]
MSTTNWMNNSNYKSRCAHHRLFDLPDILTAIFTNCNPSTTATLARVCRNWNDLVIDQLWSSLPSLLPLLRILLPLVVVGDALDFDRKAGPPNWTRFWVLAPKVRRLRHVDQLAGYTTNTQLSGRISPNVIPYLLQQQSWTGRLFILPNLARLEWSVNWEYSLFQLCHFLSPALRHLIISIGKHVPIDQVIQNLEYLAALPPTNVRLLSISASYSEPNPGVGVASAVASFIKCQPTLLALELPSIWTRGEIVGSLIRHSTLEYLDLLLCCDTLPELRSLLELLARQCPRIYYFTYNLPLSFPQLTPRDAIEPLLLCRRLRQLQIFHKNGLSVGSDDIKKMAQAWREMEVLRLCASAADTTPMGTPLALLLEFAEEFSPCLRRLALNFVFDGELPTLDVVWASFPRLEVLGVGTSKPESTAQAIVIAEFLTSVCSEQTELAYISVHDWRPDAFDTCDFNPAIHRSFITGYSRYTHRHIFQMRSIYECGIEPRLSDMECPCGGPVTDDAFDFDRRAGAPNWKRFWALAAKVRTLKHVDGQKGRTPQPAAQLSGRISPNVIPYLLLHQAWTGRLFLLPKLASLEWSVNWEYSLFQLCHFLSPALRNLIISISGSVPVDEAVQNLEHLASLPPTNVTAVKISTDYAGPNSDLQVASAVASFVKSQPTLLILDISSIWSRGEVVANLIQHSNLRYLDILLWCDNLAKLRSLLELLARQCPRIRSLTYKLPPTFPQLTLRHAVEPLLSCCLLLQLQIFHKQGLSVGSNDIKRMAQAWREMEVLRLCADATDTVPLGTPLALLLEFAEQFSPRLRRLALNFVFDGELPTADVVWTSFPKLEVLGVGTSKLTSTAQAIVIGEFLSSVCSEQTKLAYISTDGWRPDAFDTVGWKNTPEANHWAEVAAVMDCGRRIRKAAFDKISQGR